MKRIYVAGPYTGGDVGVNVATAIEAGDWIIEAGHTPYIPHLSHFQHIHKPHHYEVWMKIDLSWVEVCDAVFRLEGHSPGADREVLFAQSLGKPVFKTLGDLLAWLRQ